MRIIKLWIIALALFAAGCGSDDGPKNLPLVGTIWTEFAVTVRNCAIDDSNGITPCSSDCQIVVYNADGSISYPNDDVGTTTFSYQVSGDELFITISDDTGTFLSVVSYEIIGSRLNITDESDDGTCITVFAYEGTRK